MKIFSPKILLKIQKNKKNPPSKDRGLSKGKAEIIYFLERKEPISVVFAPVLS